MVAEGSTLPPGGQSPSWCSKKGLGSVLKAGPPDLGRAFYLRIVFSEYVNIRDQIGVLEKLRQEDATGPCLKQNHI